MSIPHLTLRRYQANTPAAPPPFSTFRLLHVVGISPRPCCRLLRLQPSLPHPASSSAPEHKLLLVDASNSAPSCLEYSWFMHLRKEGSKRDPSENNGLRSKHHTHHCITQVYIPAAQPVIQTSTGEYPAIPASTSFLQIC